LLQGEDDDDHDDGDSPPAKKSRTKATAVKPKARATSAAAPAAKPASEQLFCMHYYFPITVQLQPAFTAKSLSHAHAAHNAADVRMALLSSAA
jgi:hypothetical protein